MPDEKVFIDPSKLTTEDLPIICLSDDRTGFFGWGIKAHEHGNYNHAFILHKPGLCVTQGFTTFSEINIKYYMDPNNMLKFWRVKNLTLAEKAFVACAIDRRLHLKWWQKGYDWLGIFGQLIHLKFIQNPFQAFCSEQVRQDYISGIPRASRLTIEQPSPSDLDRIFRTNQHIFECVGYWWGD